MAWNEPGGSGGGKKNDPWGGGGDQGPPDLDEAFKKLQSQLSGVFGRGGDDGGSRGGGISKGGLIGGLVVLAVVYVIFGFYQIDQREHGVVFRFGAVQDNVVLPGLHWNPPIIDEVRIVDVNLVRDHQHQALMLTEDENIVDVSLTVQYVVENAIDFLTKVRSPEESVAQATESALRHVVGGSSMDLVITDGRAAVAAEVQQRLQSYLNNYGTGIAVSKVNIQESGPPAQVRAAFNDVQQAQEDEARVINEANAYAEAILPQARGEAQKQIEEANAYRDQVIAQAEGEAERFNKLLAEYQLAPEVTRDRLYIDALEQVLSESSKVMVDVEGGNNMMYLPLDKLTEQSRSRASGASGLGSSDIREITNAVTEQLRRDAAAAGTSRRGGR